MWVNGNVSLAAEIYQLYALVLQLVDGKSIFYYNPDRLECNWHWLQQYNNHPQWVWHSQMPFLQLKQQQNSELLVLACLRARFDVVELVGLSTSLNHLRDVPVLIELYDLNSSIQQADKDSLANQILTYCLKSSMLNVALYFQQDRSNWTLYSFSAFPRFTLIRRNFVNSSLAEEAGELFPNQLANLRGYALRIMPVSSEPTYIIYRDASGKPRISGFAWRLMMTFAQQLGANISVLYPTWRPGRKLSESYMLDFTRNGSIDFGLLNTQMRQKSSSRYYQYSFPIFYSSWCIMLPIERQIDLHAVFKRILERKALALLLISSGCYYLLLYLERETNIVPTRLRHCLRLPPWLLAVLVLCACQAQLFSLINMCPLEAPIDSFDALLASNLRIFGLREEFYSLDGGFRARYALAFRLTGNVTHFYQLRNSFNTSWAYSITAIKWAVMNELQSYFERPLFRYSELCLSQNYPHSILLADESIYRKRLMMFTMRCRSSGLINYWMRHSLFDMVKADRIQIKDYSGASEVQPLRLQDFLYVGYCYAGGILLAVIVFVAELLPFYVNVWLDNL